MTMNLSPYRKLALAVSAVAIGAPTADGQSTFSFPSTALGVVSAPAIREGSGLVASRDNPNVLWTENDAGNSNTIYALSTTGQLLGSYTLSGTTNSDWEEISIGPGPVAGVNYLYLLESNSGGDPGRVYRIPEPAIYAASQATAPVTASISGATSKKFSINAVDSESMFVDPIDGSIYIGSKESGTTKFYQGTQAQFDLPGTTTISTVSASVPLSKGNGATISPNGSEILVRNQNQYAIHYTRLPGQSIASAFASMSLPFTETYCDVTGVPAIACAID